MDATETLPLTDIQGHADIEPKLRNQLIATLCACLSSFTMGLTLGYSSPAIPDLQLSADESTWFGSLVALGAILGSPIGGVLLSKTGRKGAIMFGTIPYICGWLVIIINLNFIYLYIGRILTGIGMGITSVSVVVYVAEIASKEYRGSLGSLPQLTMVLGILAMYLLGIILSPFWLAVASMIPLTVMVIWMYFMPETPRWLSQQGHEEVSVVSLTWLRGKLFDIQEEYNDIKMIIDTHRSEQSLNFYDFIKPRLYKPLLISFGLMLLQQLTGIRVVIFYAEKIFASAGVTGPLPSIIIGIVLVVTTTVALLLMDKVGRKVLLLIACVLMTMSCALFGTFYYLKEKYNQDGIQWMSLVSVTVYIMGNAIGLGTVPWLIMSEVFPVRVRGFATSAATLLNWTCAFTITKTYYYLVESIGNYWTFWLFGIIAFSGIFFVIFIVVETKGKSLEQIEMEFECRSYNTTVMYQRL